jgi:hypothetical protein
MVASTETTEEVVAVILKYVPRGLLPDLCDDLCKVKGSAAERVRMMIALRLSKV